MKHIINVFCYVGNDPVNFFDPEGLYAGAITWGAGLVGTILIVIPEPSTTAAGTVMLLAAVATIPGDTPIDQAKVENTCDKPPKDECNKAKKLLKFYKRLAQKYNIKLSKNKISQLDALISSGQIRHIDLPSKIQQEFPDSLKGRILIEIENICK